MDRFRRPNATASFRKTETFRRRGSANDWCHRILADVYHVRFWPKADIASGRRMSAFRGIVLQNSH